MYTLLLLTMPPLLAPLSAERPQANVSLLSNSSNSQISVNKKQTLLKKKLTASRDCHKRKPVKKPLTHSSQSISSSGLSKPSQHLNLTLYEKINILDFIEDEEKTGWKPSQYQVVFHFCTQFPSLTQPTISQIVSTTSELWACAKNTAYLFYKCPPSMTFPEVKESLSIWIIEWEAHGVRLTGDSI